MAEETSARWSEWRAHWKLVLAAFAGFSLPSIAVHSTGLFIAPIQAELGWSRTMVTVGITIVGLLIVPLSPFVGALIDRFGGRRLVIPGIIGAGTSFAALSLTSGSVWQWIIQWILFAIASLFISGTIWTAAVSRSFAAARGMALAVTLSGTAFTAAVVPPLTHWLIEGFGWKQAFLLLGIGWSLPVFVLCVLFFFDAQDRHRRDAVGREARDDQPAPLDLDGLSVREALRCIPLWRVGFATLITMTLGIGILVHKVPILTEAGVDRGTAAMLASLGGVAGIAGKLVTGWLMDRYDATVVGAATMGVSAIAFAMLMEVFRTPAVIIIAMFIVGYVGGTKLQICAHLTGIYGGMRNFGKIFGVMSSVVSLAAGLGPLLSSMAYDTYQSYDPLLVIGVAGSIISGLLLIRLGRYPAWNAA